MKNHRGTPIFKNGEQSGVRSPVRIGNDCHNAALSIRQVNRSGLVSMSHRLLLVFFGITLCSLRYAVFRNKPVNQFSRDTYFSWKGR